MLFDVPAARNEACARSIMTAVQMHDPSATVEVFTDDRRVRVEGRLSKEEAIAAIRAAGFGAAEAPPHSGPGSTCCGGCA